MKKKFPGAALLILCAFIASQLFVSLSLFGYNKVYGTIGIVSAAILAIVLILIYVIFSKNSIRYFTKMNNHLENSAAEYINTLPAPIVVIEKSGRIVWFNSTFSEKICPDMDIYGTDFGDCTNVDVKDLIKDGSVVCRINDSVYNIMYEEFPKDDVTFLIAYFRDETSYYKLKKEAEEAHPNVVIMTIDTYDEIMQNAKESEKAIAAVEIEQLIEKFMSSTNGFVKKISPNTFYAVIEHRHLEDKIRGKFKILDMAREIKIAGKYSLTLSIGVGKGASSLAESEKIARQCLEMALGRGGDQAVLKTENGYRFFGGVSKGVEKMSRTKTRIIANAMQDIILNSGKVFIMGHRFGDLDSVGAACGLAGALKLMGKDAHIVVDRSKNLAVNLIEAVEAHTEQGLFITPSAALQSMTDNDLLIIVDIHNKDFIESRELYDMSQQVIVIDHHRKTVNYIDNAVIFYHEPYASSASEMVTELIQYFRFTGDEKLPSYCAEALLAGIMLDTKSFIMRTGARTFEAAAFLKKLGADTVAVKLLFSSSFDSYRSKTEIVSSARIHNRCAVATADIKCSDIRIVAPQAADELLNITDVDASFVIYKTNNVANISARSLGAINVQVIMEKLGGGGHQTMAAAQLKDTSLNKAAELLLKAIDSREEELENQS